MMNVSVAILTLNEEKNIERCIASARLITDDIVVLDSFSQDDTQAIAKRCGARFYQRKFNGYASQRNHALKDIVYLHPWVFMLDADERVTPELADEIVHKKPAAVTMFQCCRKDIFLGKWLRRSSGYPTWFPRLFKVECCWVEREVNEEYFTDGKTERLKGELEHYPFNKGVTEWFDRHNFYSSAEAQLIYEKANKIVWRDLLSVSVSNRRRAQKALVYSLPFRPLLVFLIFYILKFGFLDGRAGLQYCAMKLAYEVMISAKEKELSESTSE